MQNNVIEYLVKTVGNVPEKVGYVDESVSYTFKEILYISTNIAYFLKTQYDLKNRPVAVILPKSSKTLLSFHAVTISGNIYVPIDVSQPVSRIRNILDVLNAPLVITSEEYKHLTYSVIKDEKLVVFEDVANTVCKESGFLRSQLDSIISSDPLYILFTSGSTGVPKGVCISHQSVIDYIDWLADEFKFTSDDIFANQAPFFFDNSILDIYSTLKAGSKLLIVPSNLYSYPVELLSYLQDNKVTVIFWVPSVLISLANSNKLEKYKLENLRKVLFCGEVMPNKQLNIWRKAHPDLLYTNLYGPTEITDVCTYYIVDREFDDEEPLPLGYPCKNTEILLIGDNNELVKHGEIGEICVRGISLSHGYYNNSEKTKSAFVQNPLNSSYPELIYKTGDLAYYNDRNEIVFVGRKDFQIKHNGYRIELGEIECAASSIPMINNICVLYDSQKKQIVMFYSSEEEITTAILRKSLLSKVPAYCIPTKYLYLKDMPLTPNGKIDKQSLLKILKGE